jgi:glycosyltransferase involved in cell wall biosynthesis
MLLEAVAPLVRDGLLNLDIIGDGPLMGALRSFVDANDLQPGVKLHGFIEHQFLSDVMRLSQVLLFPSIREFGGGVVLEAMAIGIVPVVVNYGGPAELVTESSGFRIPRGTRSSIIEALRMRVLSICQNPEQLTNMSNAAVSRVHQLFTWEAKARQLLHVYDWVARRTNVKPRFFDATSATQVSDFEARVVTQGRSESTSKR